MKHGSHIMLQRLVRSIVNTEPRPYLMVLLPWLWTVVVHSPLFIVALAAGIRRAPRRLVIVAVTGMVTGIVPYLFNLQYFDDWDLVRYTLPALVPCVIVAVVGVASLVEAYVPRPASVVVLLCLAAAVAAGSFRFVAGQSTWHLGLQAARKSRAHGNSRRPTRHRVLRRARWRRRGAEFSAALRDRTPGRRVGARGQNP